MEKEIYNKNGQLSDYGLSCGYIDRIEKNNIYVELSKNHGVYFVKSNNIRESCDTLTEARKKYSKLIKQKFNK